VRLEGIVPLRPSSGSFWNHPPIQAQVQGEPLRYDAALLAAIFTRSARPSAWNPAAVASPSPWLTLREWQARAALHPLSRFLRWMLIDWLLEPTDPALWPPSAASPCSGLRCPFLPGVLLRHTDAEAADLWPEELAALRQTLDAPSEEVSGLTRNGLLVAAGAAFSRQPLH